MMLGHKKNGVKKSTEVRLCVVIWSLEFGEREESINLETARGGAAAAAEDT